MTLDIDRLRQLEAEATPGPWEADGAGIGHGERWIAHGNVRYPSEATAEADAEFIAEARNALPELLDELETLRAKVALAMEATYWDRPYDTRIAAIRAALDGATS